MKKFVSIIAFVFVVNVLFAQQVPQHTQYMFYKSALNPAATGVAQEIIALGAARYQWVGLKDDSNRVISPRDLLFNFEMPVYSIRSGVGINFNYNLIGFEKNTSIQLNYAYHQPIKKSSTLSFGFSLEYLHKSIDYSQFFTFDPGDPLLDNNPQSGSFTDIGLGIYYEYKDKLYTGFSVSQLLGSSAKVGPVTFDLVPHYYFMAGYNFSLNKNLKKHFVLATGLLVQSTISSTQYELNAILRYNNRYWGGLMYRANDAIGIMAGINIYDFSIGLSYDINTGTISDAGSKGSPEIFVKYAYPIKPKLKPKGNYNPRYL